MAKNNGPRSYRGPRLKLFSVNSVFSASSVLILFFPYILTPLHLYFCFLAMHSVQRSPKRIQRLIRGLQNFFLVSAGVLFQPTPPSRPVRLVRFLVHLEVRQPFRLCHAIKLLQAIHLCRRNFRHLRFISVECRHRFGHRPVPANLAELLHPPLPPRPTSPARNLVLPHAP